MIQHEQQYIEKCILILEKTISELKSLQEQINVELPLLQQQTKSLTEISKDVAILKRALI